MGRQKTWRKVRKPGKYHDRSQITQLKIRPQSLLLATEQAVSEEVMNKGQSIFKTPTAAQGILGLSQPPTSTTAKLHGSQGRTQPGTCPGLPPNRKATALVSLS